MSAQICRMYRLIGDNEAAGQSDSLLVTVSLVSPIIAVVVAITHQRVGDTLGVPATETFLRIEAGSGQRTGVR